MILSNYFFSYIEYVFTLIYVLLCFKIIVNYILILFSKNLLCIIQNKMTLIIYRFPSPNYFSVICFIKLYEIVLKFYYLTTLPVGRFLVIVAKVSSLSSFVDAAKIIPWDNSPLNLTGFKLTTIITFCPTNSSGL